MQIKLRSQLTGADMKAVRELLHLTQSEFAALLGISQQAVANLERSRTLRRMTSIAIDLLEQVIRLHGKEQGNDD